MSFEVKRSAERINLYGQWFTVRQQDIQSAQAAARKSKEKLSEEDAFEEGLKLMSQLAIKDDTYKTDLEAQEAFKQALLGMEFDHYLELSKYLSTAFSKKKDLIAGA